METTVRESLLSLRIASYSADFKARARSVSYLSALNFMQGTCCSLSQESVFAEAESKSPSASCGITPAAKHASAPWSTAIR